MAKRKSNNNNKGKNNNINKGLIFGDFSEGLYLLDTPRSLTDQQKSLALKGGRNIWSEQGALVPQYGYIPLASLPNGERVVGVTKDSKSSASIYILTMLGNVYHYSAYNGLKKFISNFESLDADCLFTRMNNDVVIYNGGAAYLMGSSYKEAEYKEITADAIAENYGTYAVVKVLAAYGDYFWRGKSVWVNGVGSFNITSIVDSTRDVATSFKYSLLDATKYWALDGTILVNEDNNEVVLDSNSDFKVKVSSETHEGGTTTVTKKTLDYHCYKFTNKSYQGNNAASIWQLYSGAPATGYVYIKNPVSVGQEILWGDNYAKVTSKSNLKYNKVVSGKMTLQPSVSAKNGSNATAAKINSANGDIWTLSRVTSGDLYKTTTETITEPSYTTQKITFTIEFTDGTIFTYSTENLGAGEYNFSIVNNPETNKINVSLYSGETQLANASTDLKELKCVSSTPDGEIPAETVQLLDKTGVVINMATVGSYSLTMIPTNSETSMDDLTQTKVSVGERTILPITLTYIPEDSSQSSKNIIPKLLGSANNRLLIYDVEGNIYYSAVGILDDFKQADGAGYFGNFYNDTSECLEIEDFLNGALIVKQNGLYYAEISDTMSTSSVSQSNIGLKVTKIAQIGQQYAGDHVIVKESIYAYDSNSNSLVIAAAQNVFGSIVAGKTLVTAEQLNAQDYNITSSRRCLTYNHEAQVMTLYYGENLQKGIVYVNGIKSIFPRELDMDVESFVGFNQGVLAVSYEGKIVQDFKKGTVIEGINPVANFETIALRSNKLVASTILEITELNGVKYDLLTINNGSALQHIIPVSGEATVDKMLPPLIYSDRRKDSINDSYSVNSKWAEKTSSVTRVYAPMSGRRGIDITLEFPSAEAFCLVALRLPDFSQGE